MESRSFLLDTNILLHALIEPKRLPQATQADLSNPDNRVICSVASLWEIAIHSTACWLPKRSDCLLTCSPPTADCRLTHR